MTRDVSALLPLMRGSQARLLAAVLLVPDTGKSIADLAREIGADPGNLHSDVGRFVRAGIFTDRRVGRSRLVSRGENLVNRPLTDLVAIAYGRRPFLAADGLAQGACVAAACSRMLRHVPSRFRSVADDGAHGASSARHLS